MWMFEKRERKFSYSCFDRFSSSVKMVYICCDLACCGKNGLDIKPEHHGIGLGEYTYTSSGEGYQCC